MQLTTYYQTDTRRSPDIKIKSLFLITVFISAVFFSQFSTASCYREGGSPEYLIGNITIPPLDSRTPLNGIMATVSFRSVGTASRIDCTSTTRGYLDSDFNYIGGQLYDTGLQGIAMRIHFDNSIVPAYHNRGSSGMQWYTSNNMSFKIDFIKTARIIEAGVIEPKKLVKSTLTEENFLFFEAIMTTPFTVTLLRPTCAVEKPVININLGEVSIGDFNASGRTTPTDFSIDLDCTGGTATTDVYVTLTDANNPGNTSTQLGLSPESDARGIALEVNNKIGAVSFGPDLEGIGNPGQWLDGTAGVGGFSIPLSVNYVRLPGPIKGGTANSGVTYTLNYD